MWIFSCLCFYKGPSCYARNKITCILGSLMNSSPLDKMATVLADDNFKCIFLNKNYGILICISLKFVPRSPIDNKPALIQITTPNKPQAITWTNADPVHWCIYAALGGDELSTQSNGILLYTMLLYISPNTKLTLLWMYKVAPFSPNIVPYIQF